MASRSDKLKDDQALLLMYIADELSAAERADVESRLEAEAVLQAQLEELRGAHETFLEAMGWLDAATPPVSEHAAANRAVRAIRQWTVERLARPAAPLKPRRIAPPWAYPLAGAAAIIIAVTVSVVHYEHNLGVVTPSQSQQSDYAQAPATLPATEPAVTASAEDQLPDPFADEAPSGGALDQAEGAIAAIGGTDDLDNIYLGISEAAVHGGTR